MSEIAIRVEDLSKQYYIGRKQARYETLRDTLADAFVSPFRRAGKLLRGQATGAAELDETIWALRDVSFEVKGGEVVGIIGRNGAGKSTLLKILSKITDPTTGFAEIYGRVGSLLEVGTGFHPELTGRENIYLNGAILGMRREEIERKFDQIVDFAEIEKFIDTPVKHYSSGMSVRLAFAVAAHLEPEILLVDEVLAVGDAAFQKKCLGKIENVAKQGRTVLFVSHNMAMVQMLCPRIILLQNGIIHQDGTSADTVNAYLTMLEDVSLQTLSERTDRNGKGQVRLVQLEISTRDNRPSNILAAGQPVRFVFHLSSVQPGISCLFTIYNQSGQHVAHFNSTLESTEDVRDSTIGPMFVCELDELMLVPGRYRVNVAIFDNNGSQDQLEGVIFFNVEQGVLRKRPVVSNAYGIVAIPHRWIQPAIV